MNYRALINSNFHLIRSKTLLTNDFELTVPNLYIDRPLIPPHTTHHLLYPHHLLYRLIPLSLADLREVPGMRPPRVQILSFSCSFRQKNCKIIPIWELAHPLGKFLDPSLPIMPATRPRLLDQIPPKSYCYRLQTKFAKVMFSQASVILSTGEGVCIRGWGSASRRGLHPGGSASRGVCIRGGLQLGGSASGGVCIQRGGGVGQIPWSTTGYGQ